MGSRSEGPAGFRRDTQQIGLAQESMALLCVCLCAYLHVCMCICMCMCMLCQHMCRQVQWCLAWYWKRKGE